METSSQYTHEYTQVRNNSTRLHSYLLSILETVPSIEGRVRSNTEKIEICCFPG